MAYFQPPQERPRHVKRFLTMRDIEDAAADGCREILHVEDLVITDAAREAAHDLGVAIVKPDLAKQAAAKPVTPPASAPPSTMTLSASPPPPVSYGAAPALAATAASPYTPAPGAYTPGVVSGMPTPAFALPMHANVEGHPLVQELARAIRARWRPVQRRQRQLLA